MKDIILESVIKDDFNSLYKKLIIEAYNIPTLLSTSTIVNVARKIEN
jgi:hypothetical protein